MAVIPGYAEENMKQVPARGWKKIQKCRIK
jgi:hypothetical protein